MFFAICTFVAHFSTCWTRIIAVLLAVNAGTATAYGAYLFQAIPGAFVP